MRILYQPLREYPAEGAIGTVVGIIPDLKWGVFVDTGEQNHSASDGFWHYSEEELQYCRNEWEELLELE